MSIFHVTPASRVLSCSIHLGTCLFSQFQGGKLYNTVSKEGRLCADVATVTSLITRSCPGFCPSAHFRFATSHELVYRCCCIFRRRQPHSRQQLSALRNGQQSLQLPRYCSAQESARPSLQTLDGAMHPAEAADVSCLTAGNVCSWSCS